MLCYEPQYGVEKTWWDTAIVCVIEDGKWIESDEDEQTSSNLPEWEFSEFSRCTIEYEELTSLSECHGYKQNLVDMGYSVDITMDCSSWGSSTPHCFYNQGDE